MQATYRVADRHTGMHDKMRGPGQRQVWGMQ